MKKSTYQKGWPLIICFLLPIFIMACYFAYRNMSPFGNQSILTVDLGQQYIDLFAYFKHTLLNDPSGLFYSFSKALGGEMFGTWAYYLLSPLNLLLLLTPIKYLPAGILIITLLKYGFSSLSFGYLLKKTIKPNPALTIMWSTIYSLNGWIIANQLNVMWLDGMIWLPLIILGIKQIFNLDNIYTYVITTTLAIITNYYMAYMIFIFTLIYIAFKFISTSKSTKQNLYIGKKLFIGSLITLGLTAWLTLPTLFSLIQGKAHYSHPEFQFRFEYLPVKMFSKLFNGSLDFDQLPHGLPNIFIGSVALISFLLFQCQSKIALKKRIGSIIVALILIISMCYQPLDLLWHGGQFPIWYPYRFSFIFCFWIIWIAANAINSKYSVSIMAALIIAICLASLIGYIFVNLIKFPFVSPLNFIIGIIFLLISYILLVYTHNNSRLFSIALLLLSTFEMGLNAFNSLNNISYISCRSYTHYTKQLSQNIPRFSNSHSQPFRINKTFYRSKDDPFSNHYMGGDVFDSSLESTTPKFMKRIGQPEGQGFTLYSNGTLLSDQLLGYRYFLSSHNIPYARTLSNRADLNNYRSLKIHDNIQFYRNNYQSPLVFATSHHAYKNHFIKNPIINQQRWYQNITGRKNVHFQRTNFNLMHLHNLKIRHNQLRAINPLRAGQITFKLFPKKDNSYYLIIGPQFNNKNCKFTANNQPLLPNSSYAHPIILNISSGKNPKPVYLSLRILRSKLDLLPFNLYRINNRNVLQSLNPCSQVNFINNRQLKGTVKTTTKRNVIGTSIPWTKGWHLKINGHPHPTRPIADEFLGASVKPGIHHFKLTFTPPFLWMGLFITDTTILALILRLIIKLKINKKADH